MKVKKTDASRPTGRMKVEVIFLISEKIPYLVESCLFKLPQDVGRFSTHPAGMRMMETDRLLRQSIPGVALSKVDTTFGYGRRT